MDVLGSAPAVFKEGVLTSVGFDLRQAVELGRTFLSKQDVRFLSQVLDGNEPQLECKKLNRKATFKMKYSPRSKKIHKILADLLQTFKDNLADAEEKETASKAQAPTLNPCPPLHDFSKVM